MNIDLTGRVAVVTGGSGELGRTMCRTLAECGAKVAVCYRLNPSSAEAVADEIGSKAYQVDVADFVSVKALHERVKEDLGVATILVNNAVSQYAWTTVLEQDPADYVDQFQTCVLHNLHMTKAFVPDMIEAGKGGRIIGINTECAMQNDVTQSAYVAAKRGMDGLLRVLAKEIGSYQITVNEVAPGWIQSDKIRASEEDVQAEYIKRVPMRRAGTDQEVANVVAFLASDLASFVTGAYISVSGGNVMPTI